MAAVAGHTTPNRRSKQKDIKNDTSKTDARSLKRKRTQDEFTKLRESIKDLDVKSTFKDFSDLPLSQPTIAGLRSSHFETLTDVQARTIPLALRGADILGAAKTGSGKALAFIIPVLEKLYREQWDEGLGALIISPTRELAVQIFDVLRKVGRNHSFSAGLVIGGKSLKEEADRLARMNILVCTPGRMLQHLDQTAGFDVDNLQMLVLDEADRIMDMGFQTAVDALVEHLPKTRQTLLFSATQTKKVSDLARLSLKDPEYVSVHEAATAATPTTLQQNYVVVPLPEKLDTLLGFLRSNLTSKIIVFFSSGKQVRFAYEAFRHLQPGISLLHLHGRQKQTQRLEITKRFGAAKHACLLATDVVARGVDFPAVDWVIQADCPEDIDTYIHRAGRTARYQSEGRCVLILDPSEEQGFLKKLEHRKVPIQKVNIRESRKQSIKDQLQSMLFQRADVKYLAQKAFISYTRSIHLQRDKETFRLDKLDLDGFAASMGLAGAPQIKYQTGANIKQLKNAPRAALLSDSESDYDEDGNLKEKGKEQSMTKSAKMFSRQNQDVLSKHYRSLVDGDAPGDEEDDAAFFNVQRVLHGDELDEAAGIDSQKASDAVPKVVHLGEQDLVIDSKRREKLLLSKKKLLRFKGKGTKMLFDDDGNAHPVYELRDEDDFEREGPADKLRETFVAAESGRVREADIEDKALAKEKRREKKAKRRARERDEELGIGPTLGAPDDGEDGLALLRSLPMPGEDNSDAESARPAKKAKKWDQDDSDDGQKKKSKKGKGKVIELAEQPETLEDLEALATGLLDD